MTNAAVRTELGYTVREAAEAADVAPNTLSLWESDPMRGKPANAGKLEKLYQRFRVALEHKRRALGVRV